MSGTVTGRHLSAVRKKLESYAARGIFRSYEEREGRSGCPEFHFVWLAEFPVTLVCDFERQTLTLRDLFTEIPSRSRLDADVRQFVRSREATALPAPRRIDTGRAAVRCRNRNGKLSITLEVKDHQYRYAATKAVLLAQELFQEMSEHHVEYMGERFNLSED